MYYTLFQEKNAVQKSFPFKQHCMMWHRRGNIKMKFVVFISMIFAIYAKEATRKVDAPNPFQMALKALLQKVKTPILTNANANGIEFSTINGPQNKKSKIGIVGGGVSGVHMAYSLKKMGYEDVTILEKSNRLSGKAYAQDYRSQRYTMSTMWMTNDYEKTLMPLLRTFGFFDNGTDPVPVEFSYWPKNNDSVPSIKSSLQLTFATIGKLLKTTDKNIILGKVMNDLNKYTDLHQQFFGNYQYGLMNRPDETTMQSLKGTFYNFLQVNQLDALIPLFEGFLQNNAYGPIYDLPTIYGMIWCTPNMMVDIIAFKAKQLQRKSIADLFPLMVEDQDIPVYYDFEVTFVRKSRRNQIVVGNTKGKRLKFDFLIWSGLLSNFEEVAHWSVLNDRHRKYFLSSLAQHVATSIVDMKDVSRAGLINVYVENRNVPVYSNEVIVDVDVSAVMQSVPIDKYLQGDFVYADNEPPNKKLSIVVLQVGNKTTVPSIYEVQSKLKSHYELFNAKDIEIVNTRTYQYFPRWNVEETGAGYHWDMYDLQGQNNIWFIGGSLSFESAHHVIGYNQLLLAKMN